MIATGRTPHLLYGVEKTLGIPDYIAANGNYIYYQGRVIYERYIPKDVVARILKRSDELPADLGLEGVHEYVAWRRDTDLVDRFSDAFGMEYPKLDRRFPENNEILSMFVFDDRDAEVFRPLSSLSSPSIARISLVTTSTPPATSRQTASTA
ncbi:MAG: HAD hydrolase family protein [Bacillus subtilis]|nr:HAD hydrolase family protein [Bacillus subtilis]